MRHKKARELGKPTAHRKALLANMAMSLIQHEKIRTTVPKSRALRPLVDSLITFAKRGDLHARRLAARIVTDKKILRKLFTEIGPRFKERNGGYSRMIQIGRRAGDNAPMALVELIVSETAKSEEKPAEKKADVSQPAVAAPTEKK